MVVVLSEVGVYLKNFLITCYLSFFPKTEKWM